MKRDVAVAGGEGDTSVAGGWLSSMLPLTGLAAYCLAWLSPNILTTIYIPVVASKAKLAISIGLMAAWLLAFRSMRRACLYSLPIFFLLLPFDLFYTTTYREPPTTNIIPSIVEAITETHWSETSDYMRGRGVEFVGLIGFSILAWWLGVWSSGRLHPPQWTELFKWPSRVALLFVAFSVMAVGWSIDTSEKASEEMPAYKGALEKFVDRVPLKLKGIFPFGRAFSIAEYMKQEAEISAFLRQTEHARIDAVELNANSAREVYVLAIGETGRRDRMGILGYQRNTTPRLAETRGVVKIPDMVTPWTLTTHAVPTILTADLKGSNPRKPTILNTVRAYKEAGFKTYWLSNQPSFGEAENAITRVARQSDEWIFVNPSNNSGFGKGTYDGVLLPLLRERLERNEPKQFFVIHLLGSHDSYQRRYPIEFNTFKPSLTDLPEDNPDDHDVRLKQEVNNSYDNSVLYTDHVLAEVISDLAAIGADAGLFYVADHGEDLFDGACGETGHGGYDYVQYPVASFVWLSDQYRADFHERADNLSGNSGKPLITTEMFPSMLGMAGIDYDGMESGKNIFDAAFSPARRMVHASELIDWDTASTSGVCRSLHSPQG
ncbi:phosphoethanolamine transferase [Dokdonella soli]|uniref:Sulfatase N-terminal domain-containing protein n=1 Tax=Dokdonella soli TaxID=529810 RepID=A0ABN1IN77_9GAMM